MFEIQFVPNPILQKQSKPVAKIDRKIKKLAKAMAQLIENKPQGQRLGVGLSAVQVGQLKQLFIAYNPQDKKTLFFVNPKIIWQSKKLTKGVPNSNNRYEGCLSIPGVYGLVKRSQSIKLRYTNLDGQIINQKFSGFLATVIQHEYDHLNGILFPQRVLAQGNELYRLTEDGQGKEKLEAIKWE